MQHVRVGDIGPVSAGGEHFAGDVTRRDLAAVSAPQGTALLVAFEPGAHTHWHRHPNGQFLYVVDGEGFAVTRAGEVAGLRAGDLVYAPPGEEHWHGAAADQALSHLALSFEETDWLGPVDSADYETALATRTES